MAGPVARSGARRSARRAVATLPEISETTHVWAAGEAASMQAIRTHLFKGLGLPRNQTTIRGYWKPERRSD